MVQSFNCARSVVMIAHGTVPIYRIATRRSLATQSLIIPATNGRNPTRVAPGRTRQLAPYAGTGQVNASAATDDRFVDGVARSRRRRRNGVWMDYTTNVRAVTCPRPAAPVVRPIASRSHVDLTAPVCPRGHRNDLCPLPHLVWIFSSTISGRVSWRC